MCYNQSKSYFHYKAERKKSYKQMRIGVRDEKRGWGMRIKEGLVLRSIAGTNIVVPLGVASVDFHGMITLNESGAFLWRELERGGSMESLTAALLREYEVDEATARASVEEYVQKLEEVGCLA